MLNSFMPGKGIWIADIYFLNSPFPLAGVVKSLSSPTHFASAFVFINGLQCKLLSSGSVERNRTIDKEVNDGLFWVH